MTTAVSRRSMLAGAGCAACLPLAPGLISLARAAEEQGESAICLSMLYPNSPNAAFDAARYRSHHLPLLRSVYGDSLERVELRTNLPPPPPRPAPPVERQAASPGNARTGRAPPPMPAMTLPPPALLATASLWIRDLKAFAERTAAASAQVTRDLAEVTGVTPTMQYDQVVSLLGDPRDAIGQDAQVFSSYFPASADGRFDARYYGEKVIPLMVKVYGENAIRRIEFSVGATAQGGAKPAILGTAHYYIRDRAAWDAGGRTGSAQLREEAGKYTSVRPVSLTMQVAAAG